MQKQRVERTEVKMHSCFCLIVFHVEHVHYMCLCGPEPPSAECQEHHKLPASDCMYRFQKEHALYIPKQRIHCGPGTQRWPSFSLLRFCCFSLLLFLLLSLLQNAVPDGPGLHAQVSFVDGSFVYGL